MFESFEDNESKKFFYKFQEILKIFDNSDRVKWRTRRGTKSIYYTERRGIKKDIILYKRFFRKTTTIYKVIRR